MKSIKLVSWNVNGLRAAHRSGFLKWFEKSAADVVCLQEIKATLEDLDQELHHPNGFHSFWNPAKKPGYSGTAVYSKTEPTNVSLGIGVPEFDNEGRVLQVEFKDFTLLNCYFPNSQRDHARLDYKLRFCRALQKQSDQLKARGKSVVICGDFNIAHQEIDLKNPKSNHKTAGFLPEERAWMSQFLKTGYRDVFREREPGPDHYTWWSYRPGVRAKNVGWRIDYHVVSEGLADRVKDVGHSPEVMGSDHCPVWLQIKS